jgi:drug/metabolite transporter (DMT)-like permease
LLSSLLPFVFAVLWASSYAAAKIGLLDISPFAFVAVRMSIAAAAGILLILALRRHGGSRAGVVAAGESLTAQLSGTGHTRRNRAGPGALSGPTPFRVEKIRYVGGSHDVW